MSRRAAANVAPIELVGTVADAPSGGERGAERRVDDDGAATEEREPTCNDVEFP